MAQSKSYVKKITMATVGTDPRELESLCKGKGNQAIPVVRVYGRIMESKPGTSDLGPFIKFSGEFQAENLLTGTKVRSRNLIVPAVAENFLADGISQAQKDDPKAGLEFGADITVSENLSKKGGFQFKYGVNALMGSKDGDFLDQLGAKLPALPAPASAKKVK